MDVNMKLRTKKGIIAEALILAMSVSCLVDGGSANAKMKTNTSVFTEEEGEQGDVVNGVDIGDGSIQSRDVIVDNNFSSYKPNKKETVNKFRKIASITYKNTTGSKQSLKLSIDHSESKGSEWNGSASFTAKIKTGILGKIETQVGFGLKKSRSTNEAVGYEYTMVVSPHRIGTVAAYYRGIKSYGELETYSYFTASPSRRVYKKTKINATVYKKSLDIYAENSEKKY